MMLRYRWILLGLGLLWLAGAAAGDKPERNDVRVLIDISGSMRTNDPQNLRRPALRMLVGLLQPGTRAGVWTFAKWTNPLVPMGEVNKAWKKKALAASQQIRSPGMFTDIERVIRDATKGISGPPTDYNRHLVLLTDGMVDVSKKAGESAASRQRIIDELLPTLKARGIRVHTIALSARADHELMKQLSAETGGWYQQVDNADQLSRVFLKVFEQVGKPEGVPLKGNHFTVDASVKEATLLVFRGQDAKPPVLISPTGKQYTDSDLVAGVAWYRDQGYDLITIGSPERGEWTLQADVDPDNRVMIVTDLKLRTSEVPAHLAVGEDLLLGAHLSNKGKVVDRKAFLRLLDVRADAITEAGSDPLGLNDDGKDGDAKAGDGRYTVRYREDRPFDEVELLFSVDSPTFMREKRYRVRVHEPASLHFSEDGKTAKVEADSAVLADGAVFQVWQKDAQGKQLALSAQQGLYTLARVGQPVYYKVEGKSRLGNLIVREYGPLYPPGVEPPKAPPVPASVDQAKAPAAAETAPETKKPEPAPEEPAEEAEQEGGWLMPALIVGLGNLLLIGGGLGGWWFLRRRKADDEPDLTDEIEAVEAEVASAVEDGPAVGDAADDPAADETLDLGKGEAA
ncbi:MAG: VWA domain-containing protein [Gammaproteobacteria bacterium]|nr:MAG: VWA domain-containing protein [Gammaproteobacteria bacterium]